MCEEACPVDAIELTGLYDLTGTTREEMIYDKAKLLSVFDMTKDAEPMRTGNPPAVAARPTTPLEPEGPGPRRTVAPAIDSRTGGDRRDPARHAETSA